MSVDPPKYSGPVTVANPLKGGGLNPNSLQGRMPSDIGAKATVASNHFEGMQTNKLTNALEAIVINSDKATAQQLSILLKFHPELFTRQTRTQSQTKENHSNGDLKKLVENPAQKLAQNGKQDGEQNKKPAGKNELFLTELSIAGQKKIVITKTPLNIGQQLILSNNKPERQNQTQQSQAPQIKTTANTLYARPAMTETPKPLPAIVYESMRQSLPKQAPVSNLIQTASFVAKQIQNTTGNIPLNSAANLSANSDLLNLLTKLSLVKIDKGSFTSGTIASEAIISNIKTAEKKYSETTISETIKKLLQNSGTLLEATLQSTKTTARLQNPADQDIKALLLIIKSIIEKNGTMKATPSGENKKDNLIQQLYQQTLNSLAKIQLNQTRSLAEKLLPNDDKQNTSNHLFFELPVKWEQNILPLNIELWEQQEKEDDSEKESNNKSYWHANLEFNLPDDSTLYAQIKAQNLKVDITLWSSSERHIPNLRDQSEKLKRQLKIHGIEIEKIKISSGQPSMEKKPFGISLIDVRT